MDPCRWIGCSLQGQDIILATIKHGVLVKHCTLHGHPVSQGQGHKVVDVEVILNCLTKAMCRLSMNTVVYLKGGGKVKD